MKEPLKDLRANLPQRVRRRQLVRPRLGRWRMPARSRGFYRSMGVIYMAGAGTLVGAGIAAGVVLTGLLWAFMIGSIGMAMIRGSIAPAENTRLLAKQLEVQATRAKQLESLLRVFDYPLTVEEAATKLGWTREAVIEGLHALTAEGKVIEDVHFETGEWTYALPNTQAARIQSAGSLDALDLEIQRAVAEADERAETATPPAAVETEAVVASEAVVESGAVVESAVVESAAVARR